MKHYAIIAHEVGLFLEEDLRASYVEKKSGHSEQDFRKSALLFYAKKHGKEFEYEKCYNYLKGKGKFLLDFVQTLRNEHGVEGDPGAMGDGCVPGGGKKKKKKRKEEVDEDDEEKVPGQKKSRKLHMEALQSEAVENSNAERIAAKQEQYTKRAEMQQLMFHTELNGQQMARETEDNKLMGMDTKHMAADDAEYFENKKSAIKKRQREKDLKERLDEEAARVAAEEARIAAEVEAIRVAAYAASPEGIAAAATQLLSKLRPSLQLMQSTKPKEAGLWQWPEQPRLQRQQPRRRPHRILWGKLLISLMVERNYPWKAIGKKT